MLKDVNFEFACRNHRDSRFNVVHHFLQLSFREILTSRFVNVFGCTYVALSHAGAD